jgi:WD40 repeat protein
VTITSDLDLTAIFPGLHPFDGAQAPHFRGRERQVEDLLSVMQASRFIGVVGPEGSGKTSLVTAGLVPALQRGFRGVGGTAWQVCQFRPGITPIENLAFALANIDPEANDPRLSLERQLDFTAMFRADHSGLIRAAGALGLREGENLLVCIDGLEQLFELSGKYLPDMNSGQDAELFMSNIARLLGAPGMPVYVLVTLRSEHIPSLYNFRSLHPYLGTGLYTVPMFRNDDFAEVVRHGLQTCRIDPDAGTVEALRESFGQDLRQLPSLQSWLRKAAERYRPAAGTEDRVVLGANPLSALGPLDASVPAMLEAFHEGLSERERHVMCQLFSHIAIPGEGQVGSKPQTVREVCERRDIPKAELDALLRRMARELPGILSVTEPYDKQVDHFREQPIPERSVLTLSNPWLLRGWKRLSEWLVAEREAASLYLRLSEAARMFSLGQTALLRPPDLDLFHQWWQTFRPQPAWTAQFNNQYRQADQYLKDSLSNHLSETERLEKERKEELRKARKRVMIGLTVGAVSLVMAMTAVYFRQDAQNNSIIANNAKTDALRKKKEADTAAKRADRSAREAQDSAKSARDQRDTAIVAKHKADSLRRVANDSTASARMARKLAVDARSEAEEQRDRAAKSDTIARQNAHAARKAQAEASKRADYQSAAKRVLDLLLKVRTSNFENRDSSIRFVRDVAEVYTAYDTSSRNLYGLELPDNNLYELLWNTDALIRDSLKGKSVSRRQLAQFPANGIRGMRDVALFGRERMAAVGNDPNPVVLEIPGGKRLPVRLQDSSYRFRAVEFIDRDRLLLVDVKGNPYLLDLKKPDRLQSLQPNPSRREAVVSGLAVAGDEALMVRDGKLLAFSPAKPSDPREIPVPGRAEGVFPVGAGQVLVATSNGLHRYDPARKALNPLQTDGPIQQVTTVAQAGGRLFTGNQKGEVMAYEINPGKPDELRRIWDKPIKAHKTQVTALRYDPGEEQLYTAGLDRNANIYNLGLPKDRDIRNYALHLIGFRKWIWDLELVTGPQGSRLYSADESGTLQEWVTKDSEMHRRLGEFLKTETPRRP